MESRVFPPVDGSVTLPEVVDFHRIHNPCKPLYVFSQDGKLEPTYISYLEFGRAADRVAHLVRPGREGPDGQIIAFVALSDTLLYHAVTLGILRAGFKPYPMSPRNTATAIIKLIKETSCHRLMTTEQTLYPLIHDIQSELRSLDPTYTLNIEEVPPFHVVFPRLGHENVEDSFESYPPYPQGVRPPLDSVSMYIHSSGSTGLPKTVPQTFKSLVHWASFPSVTDCKKPGLVMATMALPPFHTMGIIVQLLIGHYAMQPIGLYPPTATTPNSLPMMPTPANLLNHIVRTKSTGLATIPAFLQVWAQDKDAVRILASLQYVVYSGGSVPSKLGTFMSESGVYLQPVYGATEFGAPTYFFRRQVDEKDWEYLEFPDLINIQWDAQGDGTFELQLLNCETHQLSVTNLPGRNGYASSDLWIPHPTKPNLWRIVGRKDDVIVHTSGEKTVPAPMEDVLMASPYVMGTIMFGRERDQPGVIIELKSSYSIDPTNQEDLVKMRNLLWPIVEEANKVGPAFSRIFKEMIVITSPNKPFPRAGKGTIMRKAALSLYADEINAIYDEVNGAMENEGSIPPSSWNMTNTVEWLKNQLKEIFLGDNQLELSDDFFEKGMDSLSATIIRRRVTSALSSTSPKAARLVSQSTVYAHPSVNKLATFLVDIVADPDSFTLTTNRTGAMELLINKYSRGLTVPIVSDSLPRASVTSDGAVVLLTGSTGNLGAQILESLLRDSRVEKIYALNRPSSVSKSIMDRHIQRFNDKAFDRNLLDSSRLILLEGEASHMNLGLHSSLYEELQNSITIIIHNAWRLDFNLPLSSFEPNIQGTRNLIDLARSSPQASSVKFFFTSSVSSAYSWDKTRGPYPEEIVMNSKYAVSNGYGESKYVTERILNQSGLQATSFRIGQISGGLPNGAWATNDWVPILLKSSIRLGVLPEAIGSTSWLPMNAVSQAILDVALSPKSSTSFALNLVHPHPVAWNQMLSYINQAMVTEGVVGYRLPTVSYQEWYKLLEKHAAESSEVVLNDVPAIKLLEFFATNSKADEALRNQPAQNVEAGGLSLFSTMKMRSLSTTIDELPSLDKEYASMWIKYWKDSNFF